jgi:hypothetical protein
MLPDANGTILDFDAAPVQSADFQINIDTTYVKDSCSVIIFLQNNDNAHVMDVFKISLDQYNAVEKQKAPVVSMYPNPASNMVQIATKSKIESIKMHTITGQKALQLQPGSNQTSFSVSGLPAGIYMMHIKTTEGNTVKKLIVK